jgi:tRNA threonylcarbamoyladenosine modification (KEOPS) complex Cgi121 subunit
MLYSFEEYGKYAEITGYCGVSFLKAETYLKNHRKQTNLVELQFFDADLIATEEHLCFAVLNALQAFRSKTNVSKSVAMETMLYASAQRQIQKSIEHIGIKPKSQNFAVVIVSECKNQIKNQLSALTECFSSSPDGTVLQLTETKKQKIQAAFQITEPELKTQKGKTEVTLVNLVIEHMALLSTLF